MTISLPKMCDSCHQRSAKERFNDGVYDLMLCGYCLRSWRALGKKWDQLNDKVIGQIDPAEESAHAHD